MSGSAAVASSVLVVEDDDDCREMLVAMIELQYPGITVYSANNGRSGLERFLAHQPCVVITDLNMPELNGAQMAEQMAQLRPETCIIILTADAETALSGGSSTDDARTPQYLQKPVNCEELFRAIARCLGENWGESNR